MPDWKREIRERLTELDLSPEREAEIVDELSQHLDERYRELCRGGASDREARRLALAEVGEASELTRQLAGVEPLAPPEPIVLGTTMKTNSISGIGRDIRYAARSLAKARGFTLVAVLCLALGIGGTTTIFSIVKPVLLSRLPYKNPDRLVMLFKNFHFYDIYNDRGLATGPEVLEWRASAHSLEQIEAFTAFQASLTGGEQPIRVQVAQVTPGLFGLLGVSPARGRLYSDGDVGAGNIFDPETGVPGIQLVALISDRVWRSEFGSDPQIIGRPAKLDGQLVNIIGVMPPGFAFPEEADIWTPVRIPNTDSGTFLNAVGRLKPGVSRDQCTSELSAISERVAKAARNHPADGKPDLGANVVSLREYLVGDIRLTLVVLFVAVLFVLLIACANVASLLLARGASRQKEIAIRTSLGASRLSVFRQLLTEALVLSVLGAAAGVALTAAGLKAFLALAPRNIPGLESARISAPVLAFALGISLLTGLIFGSVPALVESRVDVNQSLKEAGAGRGTTEGRGMLRGAFVVAQVALALILLVGSGLMIKSLALLLTTRTGFETKNVLTLNVSLPLSLYTKPEAMTAFYERALQNLRAVPGVTDASVVSALPLAEGGMRISGDFSLEGQTQSLSNHLASKLAVSPDYFRSMGIPLISGRVFTDADAQPASGVVIISEALAKEVWPRKDAIGQRIEIGFTGEEARTVVGIVGDVRQDKLDSQPKFAIYAPYLQTPRVWQLAAMCFVVKSAINPENQVSSLIAAIQSPDKDIPVYSIKAMAQVVSEKVSDPRFYTCLLAALALVAIVLAAAGVYGIVSHSVGSRTHEIGIRIALGAEGREIVMMWVRRFSVLALAGVGAGLAGAYGLTRFIRSFLYQTAPTDAATFAGVSILLVAVALLASYIPARRAARVDPVVALRYE